MPHSSVTWRWRSVLLLLAAAGLTPWTLGASSGCNAPTVLVVALDGGDWRYMDPLIDAGYLPTIGAWRDAGVSAPMSCLGANSAFGCYCPIVHVSAMTGWPSAVHGILGIGQLPSARQRPAVWNVLRGYKPYAGIALSQMRNTWPPEDDPSHVITEPGALMVAEQEFYDLCTPGNLVADGTWPGSSAQPETWTKPAGMYQQLGLVPDVEPDAPYAVEHGAGFTAMKGLIALTAQRQPGAFKLTALTLHFIDKTKHITCGGVHDEPFGPINGARIVAEAAAWSGPYHPCPWGWGSTASAYVEADLLLADLVAAGRWDYVVIYSDHGMTLYPPGQTPVACHHGLASPARDTASFGVWGPGVREGVRLPAVQDVLCVAPLVAHLLKLPVSQELPCVQSGAFDTLLAEVLTPEFLAARPPTYVAMW